MDARHLLAPTVLVLGAAFAGSVACGSNEATSAYGDAADAGTGNGSSGDFGKEGGARDASPPTVDGDPVDGVVLVHASYNLPPARVCFDDRPELRPLPDDKLMPRSNLVGLDVGTAVRLPSLRGTTPPTSRTMTIYAESVLRAAGPTITCYDLDPKKNLALVENKNFWRIPITASPFTDKGITVIALEGCVGDGSAQLGPTRCGVTFESAAKSNLRATTYHFTAPQTGGVHARALIVSDALRSSASTPTLAYGELGNKATRTPFTWQKTSSFSTELALDVPDRADAFEAYGFVGTSKNGDLEQSLAATQELSDPSELPRVLFGGPSNLAVLLLGDPSIDSKTDPARGFHAVTVPIRAEPTTTTEGSR